MKLGKLITFEGIEGCGKSTQITKAGEWLSSRQVPHVITREPGGTESGIQIRKILLSEKTGSLEPVSEALLYLADRFDHITSFIVPHLQRGDLVLCDRYHDSTLAYQGYARGISLLYLDQIWQGSGIAVEPHRTLLFDVDPEIGIRRSISKLTGTGLDESRFEKESLEFHTRVRAGFLDLARKNQNRYWIINGNQPVESVQKEVINALEDLLNGELVQ